MQHVISILEEVYAYRPYVVAEAFSDDQELSDTNVWPTILIHDECK